MTRILFLGDSAGTGFGTVTKNLGLALLRLGEDVRFLSLNEQPNVELEEPFRGRSALIGQPSGWLGMENREFLRARIAGMFTGMLFEDRWTPEAAIILGDMGSLQESPVVGFVPNGFPAFHYVPVEGIGLPPAWSLVWRKLRPVATSHFGAAEIKRMSGIETPVVWHGIDHSTFYPISSAKRMLMPMKGTDELKVLRSKADCRRFLGWPEDDVILFRADRYMPRKQFPAMFRSVAPVLFKHGNVRLICHCLYRDEGGRIEDEISHYGPIVGARPCTCVGAQHNGHFVFGGIAERMQVTGMGGRADARLLAVMYNAADIYVSTSAEGFGLTIAEALACGVPAIGLNYSSVPEVIGNAGVLVRSMPTDNIYSHLWATPVEREYSAALEELVIDPAKRNVLGMKGPYQTEQFNWAAAGAQFRDLIHSAVPSEVAA
jgi:glycosyltransferase involved in cell wall biosynthesis